MNIRILVVAKHRLIGAAIGALLNQMRNIRVVAIATNEDEVAKRISLRSPDVFLIDEDALMQRGGFITELSRISQGVPVVLLAAELGFSGFLRDALRSGRVSVVLRDAPVAELYRAIEGAKRGKRYISREVVEHAMDFLAENKGPVRPSRELTSRQQEILRLLAQGHATKEIAHELSLSPRTIESHRSRIMERLGVRHLAGLVRYAISTGIIKPK